MAAFDRVLSGIPKMDENFDNIRLGDNVVWRVDDLLGRYDPKHTGLQDIIRVFDVSDLDIRLCNDMKRERIICYNVPDTDNEDM